MPVELDTIIKQMVKDKEIVEVKDKKYLPTRKPDLSILKANEIKLIDNVLGRRSDMNADMIAEYTCRRSVLQQGWRNN